MDQSTFARDVLASMFAPAVLISAAGTLVLSTSNRLGRVVDRVRELATEVEHPHTETESSVSAQSWQQLVSDQLSKLFDRALYLQTALTILYLSIGIFVGTTIAVGVVASFDWRFGWIPVVTELTGGSFLLYACTLLVREARLAVKTTLLEMDYVRKLMSRGR